MLKYQTGAISLLWVAVGSGLLALIAMGALFSMRNEHNYFADVWHSSGAATAASATGNALEATRRAATGGGDGALRKCVVNGKAVISNVDCSDKNPTSRTIEIHDSHGFEAPKVPPKPKEEAGPDQLRQKMIERATRE